MCAGWNCRSRHALAEVSEEWSVFVARSVRAFLSTFPVAIKGQVPGATMSTCLGILNADSFPEHRFRTSDSDNEVPGSNSTSATTA